MSCEISFYSPGATREDLNSHFIKCGFIKQNEDQPLMPDSDEFYWFDNRDFRSYTGVEGTVLPVEHTNPEYQNGCRWCLHTRSRFNRSPADAEQQNFVIREARRTFGGVFYNDWNGKNRYIPQFDDGRDAVARGLYLSYQHVDAQLGKLKVALPEPRERFENLRGTALEHLGTMDPVRVLYNALVPFAVAAVEHFFSQAFKIMLKYDSKAITRIEKATRKVEMCDLLALRDGRKSVEDIIASWYSFQNLTSIHNAFSEWFGIDIWKMLRRRKRIGDKLPVLETQLNKVIEFRHGVIHAFDLNLDIRKAEIEQMLDTARVVIQAFIDDVARMRKTPIRGE